MYGLKGSEFNKFPNNLVRVNYLHDVLLPVQKFPSQSKRQFGRFSGAGSNDKFFYLTGTTGNISVNFRIIFPSWRAVKIPSPRPAHCFLNRQAAARPFRILSLLLRLLCSFVMLPAKLFIRAGTTRAIVDFNYTATLRYSKGIKGGAGGQYNYHEW